MVVNEKQKWALSIMRKVHNLEVNELTGTKGELYVKVAIKRRNLDLLYEINRKGAISLIKEVYYV